MGTHTITKREINYPIAPTPQMYGTGGADPSLLLSAMFGLGKTQYKKPKPITEQKKKKR